VQYIPYHHTEDLPDMTPLEALNTVLTAASKWQNELREYIIPEASPTDAESYEQEAEAIEHALQYLSPGRKALLVYIPGKEEPNE
jgi:hypothetical protein